MDSHCACPTRVFGDRALHEHRRSSSLPSHAPSKLARYPFQGWGLIDLPLRAIFSSAPLSVAWFGPQLRTSNDHSFIVGVP